MVNGSGPNLNQLVASEKDYDEFFAVGEEVLSSLKADLTTQTIFMLYRNQLKFYIMIY